MAFKIVFKTLNIKQYRSVLCSFQKFHSTTSRDYYDVIIAGGGLVGTSLACSLACRPSLASKSILLLEGAPESSLKQKDSEDEYSNRVVSLNPGTKRFLESIGAWKYIRDVRFTTVKKMQIWDANSNAMISFDHPNFINDISYIVENDVIMFALNQALKNVAERITVKYNSKVETIALPSKEKCPVTLHMSQDGCKYTCDLLVGAEGFNSRTRHAMNVQYLSWNYNQCGLVATLRLSDPTENVVAWQRFLPDGPIALLPLTNELSSLVWTVSTKTAANLIKLSEDQFVDAVNDAIWKPNSKANIVELAGQSLQRALSALSLRSASDEQLPPSVRSIVSGSRATFPLGFGHSTRYVAQGVALVGDSAHRVHPLAGQGVNLGFSDVACLTENICQAASSGSKFGSLSYLTKYESQQQCHNFPTMLAIDGLQKLYCTTATPAVLLRSIGMQMTNSLPPIKRAIMQFASR